MSLDTLEAAASDEQLALFGTLPTIPDDALGVGTVVLLGPKEPGFWDHVTATPEFADGQPDPLDRWSHRIITALANAVGGTPLFPFGAPVRPFIGWALRSGRAWSAPVGLLVHDTAGLMVSYRGAVLLPDGDLDPHQGDSPCTICATKPCLSACPVTALTADGYDLAACHSYLDTAEGADCMSQGCAVRRSCPVSATYQRRPIQSAFHMRQFHV